MNSWIEESGYLNAYGAMVGISSAVLLFWVVLYVWESESAMLPGTGG